MQKLKLIVLFAGIILLVFYCTFPIKQRQVIPYESLPYEVKREFGIIYNQKYSENSMPPEVECRNLNRDCTCEIVSKSRWFHLMSNEFVIKTCGRTFQVPWDYIERVYVISGDTIYYPNRKEGGMISNSVPRSYYSKFETFTFIKEW